MEPQAEDSKPSWIPSEDDYVQVRQALQRWAKRYGHDPEELAAEVICKVLAQRPKRQWADSGHFLRFHIFLARKVPDRVHRRQPEPLSTAIAADEPTPEERLAHSERVSLVDDVISHFGRPEIREALSLYVHGVLDKPQLASRLGMSALGIDDLVFRFKQFALKELADSPYSLAAEKSLALQHGLRLPAATVESILNRRNGASTAALGRLQALIRPERLPDVIRRECEMFGGRSALDWILEGRIEEVADKYEKALAYQG